MFRTGDKVTVRMGLGCQMGIVAADAATRNSDVVREAGSVSINLYRGR